MKQSIIKVLIGFLLISGVVLALYFFRDKLGLSSIRLFINQFGAWAPIVFVMIYILATVFFLPGAAITIAGGLFFGPWLGTLYNITGAVIGASIAFLIARYLASDWIAQKSKGRMEQCLTGVAEQGWRFVAVVRLVPLIPFNALNYALGLTKIPLLQYIIASAIFMLPGTVAYTYLGSLGEVGLTSGIDKIIARLLIALGLLVLLALTPWFIKQWKNRHEKS